MQVFLPFFVLFSTMVFTRANFEAPVEVDVTSPTYCRLNDAGFGGAQLTDDIAPEFLKYKCLIEYTSAITEEEAIEQVDRRIAELVLGTPYFEGCTRRLSRTTKLRGLQVGVGAGAIAISTLPADEKNSAPCTTQSADNSCVNVDGESFVYFELDADRGEVEVTLSLMTDIVEAAMNEGKLAGEGVVSVEWIDSFSTSGDQINGGGDGSVGAKESEGNSSTSVIIGASVGGILALGLLAFYRRRNMKGDEEATNGPGSVL